MMVKKRRKRKATLRGPIRSGRDADLELDEVSIEGDDGILPTEHCNMESIDAVEQRMNRLSSCMTARRDALEKVYTSTMDEHRIVLDSLSHLLLVRALKSVGNCPSSIPPVIPQLSRHLDTDMIPSEDENKYDDEIAEQIQAVVQELRMNGASQSLGSTAKFLSKISAKRLAQEESAVSSSSNCPDENANPRRTGDQHSSREDASVRRRLGSVNIGSIRPSLRRATANGSGSGPVTSTKEDDRPRASSSLTDFHFARKRSTDTSDAVPEVGTANTVEVGNTGQTTVTKLAQVFNRTASSTSSLSKLSLSSQKAVTKSTQLPGSSSSGDVRVSSSSATQPPSVAVHAAADNAAAPSSEETKRKSTFPFGKRRLNKKSRVDEKNASSDAIPNMAATLHATAKVSSKWLFGVRQKRQKFTETCEQSTHDATLVTSNTASSPADAQGFRGTFFAEVNQSFLGEGQQMHCSSPGDASPTSLSANSSRRPSEISAASPRSVSEFSTNSARPSSDHSATSPQRPSDFGPTLRSGSLTDQISNRSSSFSVSGTLKASTASGGTICANSPSNQLSPTEPARLPSKRFSLQFATRTHNTANSNAEMEEFEPDVDPYAQPEAVSQLRISHSSGNVSVTSPIAAPQRSCSHSPRTESETGIQSCGGDIVLPAALRVEEIKEKLSSSQSSGPGRSTNFPEADLHTSTSASEIFCGASLVKDKIKSFQQIADKKENKFTSQQSEDRDADSQALTTDGRRLKRTRTFNDDWWHRSVKS